MNDSIILLAKKPGPTSFSSLNSVKKALATSKVGHTGTLDSFAQGLLVVCTGRLTRLAGNITEFDKTYEAVICFGKETDTLEYTGNIIKTSPLPSVKALEEALKHFKGTIMQRPPAFSAIHVNGQRASDLARSGKKEELPERPVTVYKAEIKDLQLTDEKKVQYAHIVFTVSKGTYIRSLARDIAEFCGSSAHLSGLYRTKVGNFSIENAAGFSQLPAFNIQAAINNSKNPPDFNEKKDWSSDPLEIELKEEIHKKQIPLDEASAKMCGFDIIHTNSIQAENDFKNGKALRSANFDKKLHTLLNETSAAVFTQDGCFIGLIYKNLEGKVSYKFVIN
ncbi:MAG: tRNA pseudouridine(55) synthase TruB [Treponema sp.]|nr:tRNA pseudouridine(55) synthase TruB [Treponema sp.]